MAVEVTGCNKDNCPILNMNIDDMSLNDRVFGVCFVCFKTGQVTLDPNGNSVIHMAGDPLLGTVEQEKNARLN